MATELTVEGVAKTRTLFLWEFQAVIPNASAGILL